MTPHIIAAGALVVFIVLGLACASAPKVSQDYVPPPKLVLKPRTQIIMKPEDPRIPPPENWKEIRAWEQSGNTMSYMSLNSGEFSNFSIDGNSVKSTDTYLLLSPGKHTVSFFYKTWKSVSTGVADSQNVNVTSPGQLEINMKPGKTYNLYANVKETSNSAALRYMAGSSQVEFSIVFSAVEKDWVRPDSYPDDEFLVPYDNSVPVTSQVFIRIPRGIYIVGFDGENVWWGWEVGDKGMFVNIGIPAGRHTIQLVWGVDSTIYTNTIDFTSGSKYDAAYFLRGAIKSLPVATSDQRTTPIVFDGPSITMWTDEEYNPYSHIFISQSTDTSWGLNRLKHGQLLKAGGNITLQLPRSTDNRYDILVINKDGHGKWKKGVTITNGDKIKLDGSFAPFSRVAEPMPDTKK